MLKYFMKKQSYLYIYTYLHFLKISIYENVHNLVSLKFIIFFVTALLQNLIIIQVRFKQFWIKVVSYLATHNAACRTAPAKIGLLNTHHKDFHKLHCI